MSVPIRLSVPGLMLSGFAIPASIHAQVNPIQLSSDGLAVSQPVVNVQVFDDSNNNLGPVWSQPWLLDTGASGVFAAGGEFVDFDNLVTTNAATELLDNGLQLDGTVLELGVGGFQEVSFSAEYRVDFSDDNVNVVSLPDTRLIVNPDANFGGFAGIVGMPGMVGQVTTLDLSVWSGGLSGDLSNIFMDVDFNPAVPAAPAPGVTRTVPLSMKQFEYPNDPAVTPANSPLPFADMTFFHEGNQVETEILIDTGAQLSIISPGVAKALGLDDDNDDDFTDEDEYLGDLAVSGVSGTVNAPLMFVEGLLFDTQEGQPIQFNQLNVLILDIDPEVPAIFGADFLTSGWFDTLFSNGPDGNFDRVHFDFRNAPDSGLMIFELNEGVVPEPGTVLLLSLAGLSGLMRRRRAA